MASTTKSEVTLAEAEKAVHAKQDGTAPFDQHQYQVTLDRFLPPVKRMALLLTGSFNPVTVAHLRMLELARDYYHLRAVQIVEGILSPVCNAYAKPGLAPVNDRIDMLRTAIASDRWLRVDTWEGEQASWTRTKLVLDHHLEEVKRKYGDTTELRLLSGADVARSMLNPNVWLPQDIDDIMNNYGLACITRLSAPESGQGGATVVDVNEGMPDAWKQHIDVIQDWVVNDICATNIRNKLEKGCSVKYVVPDGAIQIIHQRGLYNSNKSTYLPDWPCEQKPEA